MTALRKIHLAGKIVSLNLNFQRKFTLAILQVGSILRIAVKLSHFIQFDKGHVTENLWKLSKCFTYLFKDIYRLPYWMIRTRIIIP